MCVGSFAVCFGVFVCLFKDERECITLTNLVAHKHQHRQKVCSFEAGCPFFAITLLSKDQDIQRTRTNHYSVHVCQMG